MPSRGSFYGIIAVFLAHLIVSSSFALYYYGQDQQSSNQSQEYAKELSTALASYRSLSGSFNSSLSDYGRTLTLLSSAVADLTPSTPVNATASPAPASPGSS